MDRLSQRLDQLTPLQRAVFALKESQARLEQLERARTEPIAIIGMACRFPGGADSPESFWDLLHRGVDAIREVPPDRWNADEFYDPNPAAPGKTNSRWGGFLDQVDGFDKQFFGISEREATRMDPQQRLVLELAWEALEDAGLPPGRLAGSRTGVFLGIAGSDYCLFQVGDPLRSDAYASTGTALCIAANRVSFTFDLRGPSLALDTACSSSLVAVHQACQSLRSGESTLALAGGVNIMLCPTTFVSLTKAGLSSPDGRCRSFDARAEGYVRSEGGGVVVLKPLAKALTDGDPIHAVIRGTAVNQDGLSNGMKTPNRQAQEALLREAYARAGIEPGQVGYVEAQGTGTLMGDMIEARALGHVLSVDRPPGSPCLIGTVKTNIGHLETASGIAGLIKTALVLKHRTIPANLHFQTPNPHIPFDELRLRVVTENTPWPGAGPAVAAVSALGFGGTNAHVVLEEAPAHPPGPVEDGEPRGTAVLLPLSARHDQALRELARALGDRLGSDGAPPVGAVARTLGVHRDHHDHRLALVARSREEAVRKLGACGRGERAPDVCTGRKPYDRRPRAVFLFPGEPAAWCASAGSLLLPEAGSRTVLDECDRAIERLAGWSLSALLEAGPADPRWADPQLAEPALVAAQVALASLWRHWGIHPVAAVGFGAGEASAAWLVGALALDDALRVAIQRGRSKAQAPVPERLGSLQPRTGSIPLIAPDDGRDLDGSRLSAAYWSARARHPGAAGIDVAVALEALQPRQPDAILEIGPPTLPERVVESFRSQRPDGLVLASLAPGEPRFDDLLGTLAALYASGHPVEWSRLGPEKARPVRLPSYPWQRERCWLEGEVSVVGSRSSPRPLAAASAAGAGRDATSEWLYDLRWEVKGDPAASPAAVDAGSQAPRRWLILADASGVGERLAERLEQRGDDVAIVASDWDDPAQAVAAGLGDDPAAWHGIVHLWSLDIPAPETQSALEIETSQALGSGSALALIRALGRSQERGHARVWLVTRGVHGVAGSPAVSPAQAPIWGLGRTMALEHPRHRGGLIDLDPEADPEQIAGVLFAELAATDGEEQVAWRAGRRHVARLRSRDEPGSPPRGPRFRADGTYLVTGGLGGLARPLARWMVEQGARRLILLGRTPLPPRTEWGQVDPQSPLGRKIAAVRELEALGASVHPAAVDVADEALMTAFFETYRAEGWPPIRGVFHLAGTSRLTPLVDLEPDALRALCRPKLVGGWLLDRLLSDEPLEEFVLFSSAVSVLGSPLLGGFGAACASLDALAEYRRARGLPATVIHWGAWSASSVDPRPAAETGTPAVRRGIQEFAAEQALEILGRVLDDRPARVVAMPYTAEDWVRQPPIPLEAPILRAMDLHRPVARPVQPRPDLTTPYEAPRTELERWMAAQWAEILRMDRVGIHDNFFELGGDSLQAAMLLSRLQSQFAGVLHLLALFNTPHISGLAAYLRKSFPEDTKRLCPGEDLDIDGEEVPENRPEVITEAEIESIRRLLTPHLREMVNSWTLGPRKNRRAVFILSPPRSGTTLLRVMLAGHPDLFSPPELYLLIYNTLADQRDAYRGAESYHLDGAIRALMEAKGLDAITARETMLRYAEAGMTTQDFYRLLQDAIGSRLLVDKTPSYAMDLTILQRAEAMFEDALYVHLLRHPCGMIRSYDEYGLALKRISKFEHQFSPQQLGEMVWVGHHANILSLFETVPAHRQFQVRFEDIVRQPETTMREFCGFLGLEYHPAMARPYEDKERRMVDGVMAASRMVGDQKFNLKHRSIDPSVADRWKDEMTGDFLGPPARAMAERLGYFDIAPPRRRHDPGAIERITRTGPVDDLLGQIDELSDDEVEAMLRNELSDLETAHE